MGARKSLVFSKIQQIMQFSFKVLLSQKYDFNRHAVDTNGHVYVRRYAVDFQCENFPDISQISNICFPLAYAAF